MAGPASRPHPEIPRPASRPGGARLERPPGAGAAAPANRAATGGRRARRIALSRPQGIPVRLERVGGRRFECACRLMRVAHHGVAGVARHDDVRELRVGDNFLARVELEHGPTLALRLTHRRSARARGEAILGCSWAAADCPALWRRPLAALRRLAWRRRSSSNARGAPESAAGARKL